MSYLGKGLEGFRAYHLCGRIRGCQFRMLLFQIEEASEEPVILGIGYLGVVQNIVAVVVVPDRLPKGFDFFFHVAHYHDPVNMLFHSEGLQPAKVLERSNSRSPASRVLSFNRASEKPGLHLRSDSSSETTSRAVRADER